jgi:hypothetical protein
VPVRREKAVGTQTHGTRDECSLQHLLECQVVALFLKRVRRPTPRLTTWKTIPPGAFRLDRGMRQSCRASLDSPNLVNVTFSWLKQCTPPHGSIQDVEDHSARSISWTAWHGLILSRHPILANFGGCHLWLAGRSRKLELSFMALCGALGAPYERLQHRTLHF